MPEITDTSKSSRMLVASEQDRNVAHPLRLQAGQRTGRRWRSILALQHLWLAGFDHRFDLGMHRRLQSVPWNRQSACFATAGVGHFENGQMSGPLFPLGQVVMTPGTMAAFEASGDDPLAFYLDTSVSIRATSRQRTCARTNSVSNTAGEFFPLTGSAMALAFGSSLKLTAARRHS